MCSDLIYAMLGEETPLAASNNPYERIRDGIVAAMQQDTGGCGKCGEVCGRWWHPHVVRLHDAKGEHEHVSMPVCGRTSKLQ